MNRINSRKGLWRAAVVIALAGLPWATSDPYKLHILNMMGFYVILTVGLNLAMGFCGQFNLAMAPLFGIGAYTSALLALRAGVPVWLCVPIAGLAAAVLGAVVGLPSLKVRSHYLAIVTIGLGTVIDSVLANWTSLTNGAIGLTGIPALTLFGYAFRSDRSYYYVLLVVLLALFAMAQTIVRSPVGRAFVAIRDDYLAARASGINTGQYQVVAFALSAFFAGIAGSLYAHLASYISPDSFQWDQTLMVLAMALIGGLGDLYGSVLGAVVLTLLGQYLQAFLAQPLKTVRRCAGLIGAAAQQRGAKTFYQAGETNHLFGALN